MFKEILILFIIIVIGLGAYYVYLVTNLPGEETPTPTQTFMFTSTTSQPTSTTSTTSTTKPPTTTPPQGDANNAWVYASNHWGLQDVTQFHLTKYYSAADGAEIGCPVLINGTLYQFSSAGFRVKQIVEGEGSEYWIKWRFYTSSILLEGYDENNELYTHQLDNALVVEYVVNATNGRSLVFKAYMTNKEPLYWVNTVIPTFIPDPSSFNMGFVAVELESTSGSGKWTNPSPILGKYLAPKISGDIVPGGTIYDYLGIKNPFYVEYFGFNPPELWEGIPYILSHPEEHGLETSGSYTLYYNIKYMGRDSTLGYPLPAYTIDYMTSPDFGHGTLVITPNSLIPLQAEVIYAAESPLIPEGASLSFTVTEASLVPCEG